MLETREGQARVAVGEQGEELERQLTNKTGQPATPRSAAVGPTDKMLQLPSCPRQSCRVQEARRRCAYGPTAAECEEEDVPDGGNTAEGADGESRQVGVGNAISGH